MLLCKHRRYLTRPLAVGATMLSVIGAASTSAGEFAAMTCDELWHARNQIYADRGYCFKTEQTIAVFGKRCFAPFGVLTEADKRTIEDIRTAERAQKCKVEG